jgi:hypothetical protein
MEENGIFALVESGHFLVKSGDFFRQSCMDVIKAS